MYFLRTINFAHAHSSTFELAAMSSLQSQGISESVPPRAKAFLLLLRGVASARIISRRRRILPRRFFGRSSTAAAFITVRG